MKISNAAMTRLKKSDFWGEVLDTAKAWDYYLYAARHNTSAKDDVAQKEMSIRLNVIKKALKHIMGKPYEFKQTETGYMLVDPNDPNDVLLEGKRYTKHATPNQKEMISCQNQE